MLMKMNLMCLDLLSREDSQELVLLVQMVV
jgi:hypothetical protein